jgi:nucleoside-diphosphate-sugar epimerase
MRATVAGASGFVGRALTTFLRERGLDVKTASRKYGDDLLNPETATLVCQHADYVFNLAAQVGGIGFVEANDADCMMSAVINANLLRACAYQPPACYFFASSSCVYPSGHHAMREHDAYSESPHTGYGKEKLFSEDMCWAFSHDKNVPVAVARFHTLYGPGDIRPAGREHVIEALCKKFIAAQLSGKNEIEIWGDGLQTRNFLYIDDCVRGIWMMVKARQGGLKCGPLNLAHPEPHSVNDIVDILEEISGIKPVRFYNRDAPQGCRHKTSDNAALRAALKWEPSTTLLVGLEKTYRDLFDRTVNNELWQTSSIQTR